MDFWDTAKMLWRRWYVTVPLLLITIGATVGVSAGITPEYQSTASVLLMPATMPPNRGAVVEGDGNPWLEAGTTTMAEAVALAVQNGPNRDKFARQAIDAGYEVAALPRSPIIAIEVTATSRRDARNGAAEVIQLIEDEVTIRQAPYNPEPNQTITTQILNRGDSVVTSSTGVRRAQAVLLLAGLLLTAVLAVLVDALLRRRESVFDLDVNPGYLLNLTESREPDDDEKPTAVVPGHATAGSRTVGDSTSGSATSGSATSGSATSGSATSGSATAGSATTGGSQPRQGTS